MAVLNCHASAPMMVVEVVAGDVDIAAAVENVADTAETEAAATDGAASEALAGCRWADWVHKHSHSGAVEAWGEDVAVVRGWTMCGGLCFLNLASSPSAVVVCCVGETCRSA